MNKIFLILLMLISNICFGQYYISASQYITNDVGGMGDKLNPSIEVGKQWGDVFSIGIDYGKTSCSKVIGKDTTQYIEFRPNLNIFQVGRFVNTHLHLVLDTYLRHKNPK